MKKAFTMIELVFVIVIVGIISAMIAPNFGGNNLREAADQVISHIRYTQHLAMMDDKFDPNSSDWYKTRWQIAFAKNTGSDNQWAYTIFSDLKGTHDGNPNPPSSTDARSELAYNPLDATKFLTGGTSGTNLIKYDDKEATRELNLGHKYGISNIAVTGGSTGSTSKKIIFDYLGRPYRGANTALAGPIDRITSSQVIITLTDSSGSNIKIAIEPETGYAHIL